LGPESKNDSAEFVIHRPDGNIRSRGHWAKADERWASTEQSIRALLAIAEIHEREFEGLREANKELRESSKELRESSKELRESSKELREAGKATDERLSVLINVLERHISEGHNQKRVQE
jgi:FtsZ-binding cell division protein ZapB